MNYSIRIFLVLIIALYLGSCGSSRKVETSDDRQNYLIHKVVSGETAQSISEKYRLTIDDLRNANEGRIPALAHGSTIKIPRDKIGSLDKEIKDPDDPMFDTESEVTENTFRNEINFSVLLPFYLEYNSKLIDRNSNTILEEADFLVHEKSIPALQFYEGALLAKNELKKEGINVNLNALDIENDKQNLEEILNSEQVKNSDILIGYFGTEHNELSVNLTKQNMNDLVITKSFKANYLDNNDHVIIAHPSGTMQCKMMAEFINSKYGSENIIIVNQENEREEGLSDIFKSEIPMHKTWSVPEYNEEKLYLEAFQQKLDGLIDELEVGRKNIIVITSSSEFIASRVMTKLYSQLRDYEIIVCGLPTWQEFQSIDVEVMQDLNLHYFTTSYLDDANPLFQTFRKNFINKYYTEPSPDAFDGYSLTLYLARAMYQRGKDFRSMLLLGMKDFDDQIIDYHYVEEGGGLENRAFYILKYENFSLIQLRP